MIFSTLPIVLTIHAMTGFLGAKAGQANQQRQGAMQRFGQLAQSGILHTMSPEKQQAAKKALGTSNFNAAIHQ